MRPLYIEADPEVQVQRALKLAKFRYLPILFIAGFVLEIATIIWMGRAVGVLATLFLLFAGGFAGLTMLRMAGTGLAETFRSPVQNLAFQKGIASKTMLRVISGFLFIVPGFISDILAVLILLPPVERWLASKVKVSDSPEPSRTSQRYETVIDVEAIEISGEIEPPGGRGNRP